MSSKDFHHELNETTQIINDVPPVDDDPTLSISSEDAAKASPKNRSSITDAPQHLRGPRIATVVWGILIMVIAALLIAWGAGVNFDVGSTAAISLAVAGIALVIAALLPARRK